MFVQFVFVFLHFLKQEVRLGLSFKKGGCLPCRQLCDELNALRVKVEASKILYWMLVFFEKTKLDNKFRNADYES